MGDGERGRQKRRESKERRVKRGDQESTWPKWQGYIGKRSWRKGGPEQKVRVASG